MKSSRRLILLIGAALAVVSIVGFLALRPLAPLPIAASVVPSASTTPPAPAVPPSAPSATTLATVPASESTPPTRKPSTTLPPSVADTVKTQGEALLKSWERASFKELKYFSQNQTTGTTTVAGVVLPPPDEETRGKLRELVAASLRNAGLPSGPDAVREAEKVADWPDQSRVVFAIAGDDGRDATVVLNGADERNITIDPLTGKVGMNSHSTTFSPQSLSVPGRYSHLFQVQPETATSQP